MSVMCRTVANYIIWRMVMMLTPELTDSYQEVDSKYKMVLHVSIVSPPSTGLSVSLYLPSYTPLPPPPPAPRRLCLRTLSLSRTRIHTLTHICTHIHINTREHTHTHLSLIHI